MATFNLQFPDMSGMNSTDIKRELQKIKDYVYMLNEQLRYHFSNIDETNIVDGSIGESALSIPVKTQIQDTAGNVSKLQQTAKSISADIESIEGDLAQIVLEADSLLTRVENNEGDISSIQQAATALTSRVSNAEGNISTLTQTASSLTSRVSSNEGDISTLQQTATSLQSQITNNDGDISTLQQTATSLQSQITNNDGDISTLQQTTSNISASVQTIQGGITNKSMVEIADDRASIATSSGVQTSHISVLGNQINIATGGKLNATGAEVNIKAGSSMNISSGGDINVAAGGKINLTTANDLVLGGQNITAFANDSINLAVSNIHVGGANLITNSDWTQGLDWGKHPNAIVQHSSDSFDGKKYINLTCPAGTSATYIFRDTGPIDLSGDTEFTASVWHRLYSGQYAKWPVNGNFVQLAWLDGNGQMISYANFNQSHISTASGWQRFVGKATVPATAKKLRLALYTLDNSGTGNVCAYANAQVQEGNKVTPWGPHKDDPASGVKTSSVEVNSNGIYMDTTGTFNVNAGVGVNIKGGTGTNSIGISNNDANNYFLWAGHGTPASAPFSVKRDGSVKATKIQHEMPYTFWDMADGSIPAEFPVYIPSGYTIDSVTFTFQTKKARTFAKSAASNSTTTVYPSGTALSTDSMTASVNTGSFPAHSHVVTGSTTSTEANHSHRITDHQHYIDLNHSHEIAGHTHGINYGIKEKATLATSCALKVGATTIGTYSPNPSNPVELKAHMSAGWNTVIVAPNDDARIVAFALVKLTPA